MRSFIRRSRAAAFATVIAAAAGALAAPAAHADYTTCTDGCYQTSNGTGTMGPAMGGPISRDQMIRRAQDWVTADGGLGVWYYQTKGWTDAAVGGPYRADCSGLVSMAWGLSSSYTTYTLPNISHELTSGGSADYAALLPGDILMSSGHVVLFAGWADGAHTTAAVYEEHKDGYRTTGPATDQQSISGLASGGFLPYRYNKVVESGFGQSAADEPNGGVDMFTRASNGHLVSTYKDPVSSTWRVYDLTATVGSPVFLGSPATMTEPSGGFDVFTNADNGDLVSTYKDPLSSTWRVYDLTKAVGSPVFTGSPATMVEPSGGVDVFTQSSVDGHLISTYKDPGSSTWRAYDLTKAVGSPVFTGSPATMVEPDGGVDVFTQDSSNGHLISTYKDPGSSTWRVYDLTNAVGSPAFTYNPATMVEPNGGVDVFTNAGGHLVSTYKVPGSSTWRVYDLTNAVGSPIYGASPVPLVEADGGVDVLTNAQNHLVSTYKDPGSSTWKSYDLTKAVGSPAPTGAPLATLVETAGGDDVFTDAGGHLVSTYKDPASSTWKVYDLTSAVGSPQM
ncbi:MAG: hypothetical protein HOW97_05060 [Catenulispora sp.]|nr:hypothetical protein [Catenulispora sp.]